jgi:PAS domain S-box-containing protein
MDRAAILIFEGGDVLRFKAWRGLSDEYRAAVEGHSPWAPDATDAEPFCVADVEDEDDLRSLLPALRAEGIGALAFIPLTFESRLLGQVMLYYNHPHQFSAEEVRVAQTMAGHVAFAIERGRTANALVESEQRFRRVVETANDGVMIVAADDRITYVNGRMAQMLGYETEDMLRRPVLDFIPESDRAEAARRVGRQATGLTNHFDLRFACKDGSTAWGIVSATPFLDSAGDYAGMVALVTDITQRRRIEELQALLVEATGVLTSSLDYDKTMKNLAELLVPRFADICSCAVFRDDGAWRVATRCADPAHAKLVSQVSLKDWVLPDQGVRIDELVQAGKSVLLPEITDDWAAQAAPSAAQLEAARQIGPRSAMIVPISTRGRIFGAIVFLLAQSGRTYTDEELRTAQELARRAAIAIDNARMYDRAREMAERLRVANEAKDEFIGMMSHELRTPTTTIYGGVRLLRSRAHFLTDEDREALFADIEMEAERLGRMIEDLLLLSRVEPGSTVATEPVLLKRVLDQATGSFRQRNTTRTIDVKVEDVELAAAAEPMYLDQVLRNVLANADKYSPPDAEVEVLAERQGEDVVISVLDSGVGVPEEDLERIFERFYRREETSRYQRGAGLGLTVCRRLMEAQSGRIWADLRPGGGLAIRMILPAVDLDAGA